MANITKVSPFAPSRAPDFFNIAGMELFTGKCGFYKHGKLDLLVVIFDTLVDIAGVFTKSTMASATVLHGRNVIAHGKAKVLVVNSGNSLAMTGEVGPEIVKTICRDIAKRFNCLEEEVITASTGVIGKPFAPEMITSQFDTLTKNNFYDAIEAINTTDTFRKISSRVSRIGETEVKITGICKGSGMIEPNMATMLGFIFTDASLSNALLQEIFADFIETTFNSITVDSDTSTSDTVLCFATRHADNSTPTSKNDPLLNQFKKDFYSVLEELATKVVMDGEGVSKFITIHTHEGITYTSAKKVAKSIANSPLVKTAISGEDANWGRIAMAIGKTLEPVDITKLRIDMCGITIMENGVISPSYDESLLAPKLKERFIEIGVFLGVGDASARVWTGDLTHEYIAINADYRS